MYTVTLMNPVASMGDNGDLLMEFVVKQTSPANGTPQARPGHDDTIGGGVGGVNSEEGDGGGGGCGSGEGRVIALAATDPHPAAS